MDLRKIKTVFICPEHNEKYKERCAYMVGLLKDLGFERVAHYKSGKDSADELYPLNFATYNILQMHMDEPVLILEDDIEFLKSASFFIDPPNNADAVYVGICGSNYNHKLDTNGPLAEVILVNRDYVKVNNMLSAHAILYISRVYKERIANALKVTMLANDIEMTKHQSLYNVYALRTPICWQSARFNPSFKWVEYATKRYFDDNGYTIEMTDA